MLLFSSLNSLLAFNIRDESFAMYSSLLLTLFVFLVRGGRLVDRAWLEC